MNHVDDDRLERLLQAARTWREANTHGASHHDQKSLTAWGVAIEALKKAIDEYDDAFVPLVVATEVRPDGLVYYFDDGSVTDETTAGRASEDTQP